MMRRYLLGILCVLGPMNGPAFAVLEDTRNVTLHSGATANGDGTSIPVNGYDVLGLDIDITNTATVTVQGRSALGGTYRDVTCYSRAANSSVAAVASSANLQCAVSGLKDVKAPISSCSSCTVSVKGQLTTASSGGAGGGGGGGGGTQYAEDSAHVSGDQVTLAGVVRQDATAALAADGDRTVLQVDSNGNLKVVNSNPNLAADNSTNSTAKVPTLPCTATAAAPSFTEGRQVPCSANLSGAQRVVPQAGAAGGADGLSYISVGTSEDEHAVKATAGTLYSVTATNTNAAVRYLKCENDTAANTAPGTDTPELRIAIPGATTGAGFTVNLGPTGWAFSTALTCWLVTGAADSDVAEVAANELMVFYVYK